MLITDARTPIDRTVVLVEIPEQYEHNSNGDVVSYTRKFNRREEYALDPEGWIDDEAEHTGVEEIKVVRVTFENANFTNMLDDGHETIGFLARLTYGANGVFSEGDNEYPNDYEGKGAVCYPPFGQHATRQASSRF